MKSRVSFLFFFLFFFFFAYPAGNCPLADNLAALSSGHTRDGNANRNDRNVGITTITHVDSRITERMQLRRSLSFAFCFVVLLVSATCPTKSRRPFRLSCLLFSRRVNPLAKGKNSL